MPCDGNPIMYSQGVEYEVDNMTKEQTVQFFKGLFPADTKNKLSVVSDSFDHHQPVFQFNADYNRKCAIFEEFGVECHYVDDGLESQVYYPKQNPLGTKAYLVGKGEGPYPPDDGTPIFQINPVPGHDRCTGIITGDSPSEYFDIDFLRNTEAVKYIPENYMGDPIPNTIYYPKNFRMNLKEFFSCPFMCWGSEYVRSTMIVSFRILWEHGIREIDMYKVAFKDGEHERSAIELKKKQERCSTLTGWYEGNFGNNVRTALKKLAPIFEHHGLKVRNTTPNSKLGLWEE